MTHPRVYTKWKAPPGAVNIGRPGFWGNPIVLAPKASVEQRRDCLRSYIDWLAHSDEGKLRRWCISDLEGQHLACPGNCAPRLCHGDVLARLADGMDLAAIAADLGLFDDRLR